MKASKIKSWVQNQTIKMKYPNGSSSLLGTNKNWVHAPDALTFGRVEYTVKFLGEVEASQAKGTAVIKEAIQKIRFNLQVRKSQGYRLPRVEIHASVEGVCIVDPKSKMTLYRFPLHRISFCADDKQDKRVFAFIAKRADAEKHDCFVFLSDRLAEEITLTIGQAFDLAYRKFMETNGKDLEIKKLTMQLKKRIGELETENNELRVRLSKYEPTSAPSKKSSPPAVRTWENFSEPPPPPPPNVPLPPTPAVATNRQIMSALSANGPEVGRKLQNLAIDEMDDLFDDDFDPRGEKSRDAFGLEPFVAPSKSNGVKNGTPKPQPASTDDADGEPEATAEDFELAISLIDSRLAEMREGFRRGLSFGNADDFQIADLDPLNGSATSTVS